MNIYYRLCGNKHINKYAEGEQEPVLCEVCGLPLKPEEFIYDEKVEVKIETRKEIFEPKDSISQEQVKKMENLTRFAFKISKLDVFLQIPDEKNGVVLGRAGLGSEDELWGPNISRRHLLLMPINGGVWIEDMGSTNGTIFKDKRLAKNERVLMMPGEKVILDAEINDIELILVKNLVNDI